MRLRQYRKYKMLLLFKSIGKMKKYGKDIDFVIFAHVMSSGLFNIGGQSFRIVSGLSIEKPSLRYKNRGYE